MKASEERREREARLAEYQRELVAYSRTRIYLLMMREYRARIANGTAYAPEGSIGRVDADIAAWERTEERLFDMAQAAMRAAIAEHKALREGV